MIHKPEPRDSKSTAFNFADVTSYRHLTDSELESEIKHSVDAETGATLKVLHLLAEVERRRLYSKTQPSLFDYCVRVLKYSGGSAQRRIDSMRALKIMPEIEQKILSGALNLTSIAQAQNFFRYEAKAGKNYSTQQKKELLKRLENKTSRECLKTLLEVSPNALPTERRRPITADKTELRLILDQTALDKLDRLKALLSHKRPRLTDVELIDELADMALSELDPLFQKEKASGKSKKITTRKARSIEPKNLTHDSSLMAGLKATGLTASVENETSEKAPSGLSIEQVSVDPVSPPLPAPEVPQKRRAQISRRLKKQVYLRDGGKCTYPGCSSEHFLEIDHIKPKAFGGGDTLDNLRLLCRTHNQRVAIDLFGFQYMESFLKKNARTKKQ